MTEPTTTVEIVETDPPGPLTTDHARQLVAAVMTYAGILILLLALLALHTGTRGPWLGFAAVGLVQALLFGTLLAHRAYTAWRQAA